MGCMNNDNCHINNTTESFNDFLLKHQLNCQSVVVLNALTNIASAQENVVEN